MYNNTPKPPSIPTYAVILFTLILGLDLFIWFGQINNQLFLTINSYYGILPDQVWDTINLLAYTKYMLTPITLILLAIIFRRDKLINILLLIGSFFVIFAVLKHFVGEPRPYVVLPQNSFHWINNFEETIKSAYKSFPSGHTGNIAILAFTLNYLFFDKNKLMQFIMLLLVLIVAVTRICSGWHWPVDVISSGLIAYALVKIILPLNLTFKKRRDNYAHY